MTAEPQSDEYLLSRICARDAEAFETLLARYQESVRGHLLRMVRDLNTTEDLTQEVFVRVWTRAEQWNGHGPFRAWLLRIATNTALNYLRTVRRRRECPLELPTDSPDDDQSAPIPDWMIDRANAGPERALEQGERRRQLQHLVEELPREKREVFRMVFDAEMEIKDVAESLGVPPGTVRSRLHYIRKRLAREWDED
ncbi:MAG: polymerase subunit sigma-70 [Chthonomonadales bacterium]|nr:polymerase subunit sigma-70 [Chthonomonadales bacterium]